MPLITETGNTSNSHQSAALDPLSNEFIPYVLFDKETYKHKFNEEKNKNDTITTSKDETVELESYFEQNYQNEKLQIITLEAGGVEKKTEEGKTIKTDSLYFSFNVLNGTGEEGYDSDGVIDIKLSGDDADKFKITEPQNLPRPSKFSDSFMIELTVDVTEQKDEMSFYVDFYADDNKGVWLDDEGETKNIFCGRVKVEYKAPLKFKKVYYSISLMKETDYRSNTLYRFKDFIKVKNSNFGNKELKEFLELENTSFKQSNPEYDGEAIHFLAIFSHGITDEIFGDSLDEIEKSEISSMFINKKITFSDNSLIYLGACNAGTGISNSFAQQLAISTGADVIGMVNDGVAPVKESTWPSTKPVMSFGPKMGNLKNGKFYKFSKDSLPKELGKYIDVIKLIEEQKSKES